MIDQIGCHGGNGESKSPHFNACGNLGWEGQCNRQAKNTKKKLE